MNELLHALSDPAVLMSLIIFLPTVAALVLLFFPKGQDETIKQFSLITTIMVFALTVWIALPVHEAPKPDTVGFWLGTGQMQYEIFRTLDTGFQYQLPSRPGRHQPAPGRAHLLPQRVGHVGELADPEARPRLLHPLPAPGDGHAGRFHVAGFLPLLCLLGSDAPADVLSHRRVGRTAAGVRGHKVLPLYARRQRAHAHRPVDALLQQRRPPARSGAESSNRIPSALSTGPGSASCPIRPSHSRCSSAAASAGGHSCCYSSVL